MIRKGRRAGRHQRLLRFSGKDEKDKWKRKRAHWWERNNEWQRKANEGKGATREARREERKKKGRGRLAGSPASLRDLHEGRPTRSCSLRLHELPLLSGQTCGENKRAQAWHGYRMVSNFVLLYALYGDTPYITAANRSVLARNRTRSQARIRRHRLLPRHVFRG